MNPKELIRWFCPFPTYFLFFIIGIKQWKILSQAIDKCYLDLVGKSMCQSYGLDPSMETIPKIQIIYRAVHKFSIIFIYRISANSFRGNYSFFNLALWSQIRKQKSRETKVTSGQRKATELISLKTNAGVFFFVFVSDFPALSHQKFKVVWKQMNGPVVTYWIFTVFPTKSLISRLRMTSCKQSLQTSFQWDWTL